MVDYSRHLHKHLQREKATQFDRVDPAQVVNSSGAFVFQVGPFERLERFLILGAEGGTYYASERQLTRENAASIGTCLDTDPARTVRTIVEVSEFGRAPKQAPGIFALALAASHKDPKARREALAVLPMVCRTGRSLLEFVGYIDGMRGWGKGLRRAVGAWYTQKPFEALAYQLAKYRGAGKDAMRWTHRDVLRKAHPSPHALSDAQRATLRWAVGGELGERVVKRKGTEAVSLQASCGELPAYLAAFDELQRAPDAAAAVKLIQQHGFTHEMVPSQFKSEPSVWEALLQRMPLGALVRNLGKLSSIGLVTPGSLNALAIRAQLTNINAIRRARLHPIAFLSAQMVYRSGHGVKGKLRWEATPAITEALEASFYLAFGNVKPTGKRLLLALDVSGSMQSGEIAGIPGLTPAMATAAMALVTMRTEPKALCFGFSHRFEPLGITADMPLDAAMRLTKDVAFGNTDCSLPFRWALSHGVNGPLAVDGFAVYTDSETNSSQGHPHEVLQEYRQKTGIEARLAVAAFTSNRFTIADPNDAGMLDVVGFDASAPAVMGDFFRGKGAAGDSAQADEDGADEAA